MLDEQRDAAAHEASSNSTAALDLNSGALAPVADEVVLEDLEVDGNVPPELDGTLVRNGPNPFAGRFEGDGMLSWWVGPAMLHGVSLRDGRALAYRNRWIETSSWKQYHGIEIGDAEEAQRTINANVAVVRHAGRTLALSEGGLPFEIASDLSTGLPVTYGGTLPNGMTAHPKIDPRTGELIYFRADWQAPYLSYGVLDEQGHASARQEIELPAPAMMHDMAITERHSLLLDLNVSYDFALLSRGQAMPLRWNDQKASRIGVLPRHGGPVQWFEIAPCMIQHVVNAYESPDDTIGFEAVRYDSFLRFDDAADAFEPNPLGVLWHYTLDLSNGIVRERQLDDQAIELPRMDERRTGRPYRYLYAVQQPTDREMRGIIKYDRLRDTHEIHAIAPGDQNSEPIFVPRNDASDEDCGWILVCVYRKASHTTDVAILDARQPSAPPVATIRLPRRIPAGFHGAWLASPSTSQESPRLCRGGNRSLTYPDV